MADLTETEKQERDAVRRERAAYVAGIEKVARVYIGWFANDGENVLQIGGKTPDELAAKKYPLPKVIRPKTITANGGTYRVVEGRLEYQTREGWKRVDLTIDYLDTRCGCTLVYHDLQQLGELLVGPWTEEIDQ